ncbi:MAG: DUF2029 domain-containing protein, partial [Synergistales bacterium]|nr:DUF2029 domain-containing protein [Synergistales bacterium]
MNTISHRHVGLSVLVICVWVSVLAGTFYLVAKPIREPSIDFYSYYIAASAIHRKEPVYAAETHESVAAVVGIKNADRYPYPPTLAALIQPFLLTSPYVASLIWFGINVGLLLIGVGLLYKHINFKDHRVNAALLLLPMLFTLVLMTLYLGQANILMFVLISLSYLTFVRERPYISGAILALSAWIKVWPIVLVAYFVWKREWKVVLGAIVGLVGVGIVTLVLAGPQQTASFFTDQLPELIREGTYGQLDHLNQSIPGTFAKMFAPASEYVRPFIENPALARQGGRIASLILVAATVILSSWPITLKNREQLSTEFMLVTIATMLIIQRLWE